MKATELMINDWVCLVGDVDYEYPVRVEVMDMSADILITSDRDDVGFEGVMPIPLTEDIIKLNGFEKGTPQRFFYDDEKGALDIVFPKDQFGHVDVYIEDEEWKLIEYKTSILYVHELQHALRLCGLHELADNFKIK